MNFFVDRCSGKCMGTVICCIYMIMRISTKQKYIGLTEDFYKRIDSHYYGTLRVDKAIRKYGKEDFIFQVLEILPNDKEILNNREKFWINYYNTYKNSFHYNQKPGGYGYGKSKSEAWNYSDEICRLYKNNETITQDNLAKQFNCSLGTIERILKKNNIKTRRTKSKIWNYSDKICKMYQENNRSISKIAEYFDCSNGLISNILKENNVNIRHENCHTKCRLSEFSDDIYIMYKEGNKSISEIANYFNFDEAIILAMLEEMG